MRRGPQPQPARAGSGRSQRSEGYRLRVQGAGEHGPEPSRPDRLPAGLLGHPQARHEAHQSARRQRRWQSITRSPSSRSDRELADVAVAGDIVGIPNHGTLRVGDTLTEKGDVAFTGLPDFAPEILRRVRLDDPLKVKQMRRGLKRPRRRRRDPLFKPRSDRNGSSAWSASSSSMCSARGSSRNMG